MLVYVIWCCVLLQATSKPIDNEENANAVKTGIDNHETGTLVKRNTVGYTTMGGGCGCGCHNCGGHIGGTGGGFGTEQHGVMNWDHGCNCGPGHSDDHGCCCGNGGYGGHDGGYGGHYGGYGGYGGHDGGYGGHDGGHGCGCCLSCGGHIGGTGGGFGTEQGGVMNWDHGCNCGPGHSDCCCGGGGGHDGGYGGGYGGGHGGGYGGGYGGGGYGGH